MSSLTYGRGKLWKIKNKDHNLFLTNTGIYLKYYTKIRVFHLATPTYNTYIITNWIPYINSYNTDYTVWFVLVSDWFESTRVFEAIGLIAAIVGLLFLVLYTCVSKTSGNKIVAFLTAILTLGTGTAFKRCIRLINHMMIKFFLTALYFITGGVIMLGVIIYGSKVDTDYLQWAFALAAASGCLYVISGVLLFVSMCSK